jgi:7,8-dihydro-6-hydroxymethylpterin-pyrophosphokinase
MKPFRIADLKKVNEIPSDDSQSWLVNAEGSIDFLRLNAESDDIVIYASGSSILVHGVLAPTANLTPPDGDDLQNNNIPMPDDSWRIQQVWGGGEGHRMYLEAPLSSSSKSFQGGEKLIFRRSFTGVTEGPSTIELSQKLIHSLDLHYMPERTAYCRLDSRGDIEDVIKVAQLNKGSTWNYLDVVTIRRKSFDAYMALTNTSLVLRFDFTRVRWGSFGGWGELDRYNRDATDHFYHGGTDGQGSYCNGAFIVHPRVTVDDLVQAWKDEESNTSRSYAAFKIYDRKNDVNVETSCAPEFLSNYFQKSDLPWEISPAFFRPEVLHRFKADPEKYTLEDRSVSCRNAWYLKTYDINEAGQVHTYIGYLADLPYEEQLYWLAFNEWPKGLISARAHQTDIVGDWHLEYEPLATLKHTVALMDKESPAWWKPRGDVLSNAVRYPATDSTKEWGDEVLALDQYLVEGFLLKPLREIAEAGGRMVEQKWAPLRVLQEVLAVKGCTDDEAKSLVLPMQKLHALRTEVRGHATTDKKRKAESEARTNFGTLRAHFTQIVTDCERALAEVLSRLDINLKS